MLLLVSRDFNKDMWPALEELGEPGRVTGASRTSINGHQAERG